MFLTNVHDTVFVLNVQSGQRTFHLLLLRFCCGVAPDVVEFDQSNIFLRCIRLLEERFNGEMELEINQKMRSQIHLFCWLVEEKQVVVLYSAPYNFFSNDEEGFDI